MSAKPPHLISIVGPTAVGKTSLAIQLALHFNTEIISADSRQFFREMEIGTAKPSQKELLAVRHYFIDSHSIKQDYSVGQFERDALALLEQLFHKHQVVVAVGGSGLYLKALWEGLDEMPKIDKNYRLLLNDEFQSEGLEPLKEELKKLDPAYYEEVDRANHQRIIRALEVIRATGRPFSTFRNKTSTNKRPFKNIKIGLNTDREVLFDRINERMGLMIEAGLFEEAEKLYPYRDHNALQTVGYSEIFNYFDGQYDKAEAVRLLKRNSRRYAKRQLTWFKKDPEIQWISPGNLSGAIQIIEEILNA